MKNILVPIGASPNAHEILQYAVDFAEDLEAMVFVMEVFNVSAQTGSLVNISEKVAESSKVRLKGVIGKVKSHSVNIKIATYNGDLIDGIKEIDKELGIDLIILSPRSNDINEELYLGNTSGKIIKHTNIPALIVSKGTLYSPFKNILVAFKSGILKKKNILTVLKEIQNTHNSRIDLLQVKTPGYTEEDLIINPELKEISTDITLTENVTTYLGVLEHFQKQHPDLLCVFRRKRGFFKKLWEKNTILKSEFYVPIPVLVLSVSKD